MDDMYRRARRYTAGRTVLDTLALVFLLCSIAFWGTLHYQVLVASLANIPQLVVAVTMTMVYSLALPLLLSMLVPTTPAGQLLQKTQWRTIGFPVIIASAVLLGYHAFNLMLLWFAAQPGIADAGQTRAYALSAAIGFVVIPALCWVQASPERWIREIEQAHNVRKLELMHNQDLLHAKAAYARSLSILQAGLDNATLQQRQYVAGVLTALHQEQNNTLQHIGRLLGTASDVELALPTYGDGAIGKRYDELRQLIESAEVTSIDDSSRESAQIVQDAPAAAHVNSRLEPSIPREAPAVVRRHTPSGDDAYLRAARQHFGVKPWTIKRLADALGIGETSARELKNEWQYDGLIAEAQLGRWCFTE